jgi:hypothetical protein
LATTRTVLVIGCLLMPASMAVAAEALPAGQEVIYSGEATSILGRMVHAPNGSQVGRIVDVLVDDEGQPRAAVIDFGGFMGIGKRRIAVAWRALRFLPGAKHDNILIDLTVDQIKATPEYKPASKPQAPLTVAAPPPPPGMPTSK